MLVWPAADRVIARTRGWAQAIADEDRSVLQIGCYGSYARGTAGVGSDLDIVVIVKGSAEPFERRPLSWQTDALPVPADVIVYTAVEWDRLAATPFGRTLRRETRWLWPASVAVNEQW